MIMKITKDTVPYDEADKAYKLGIKAGKKGLPLSSNPYEKGTTFVGRLHQSWGRGWLRGSFEIKDKI